MNDPPTGTAGYEVIKRQLEMTKSLTEDLLADWAANFRVSAEPTNSDLSDRLDGINIALTQIVGSLVKIDARTRRIEELLQ